MKSFQSDKCAADILESVRRMGIRLPFDERGCDTAERQGSVCGNGDLPIERPTAHCFNGAQGNQRRRRRGVNVVGSADPGCEARCRVRAFYIELEPTRAIGISGGGVNRDDFEIQAIPESEQAVVSPHARMLTSGFRRHAEGVPNVLRADLKRRSGDDYVVDT